MRLAILHPFLLRLARGSERCAWSLADALARKHVEVDVLTWNHPRTVDWGLPRPGVRILKMPYLRYFEAQWARLYYLYHLYRGAYDWTMVFFAGYGEAQALRVLRTLHPQKYCIVFQVPADLAPLRFEELRRLDIARRADRLIAVSKIVGDEVERQFGRRCEVIANGVDADHFAPSAENRSRVRAQMGVTGTAPILISLAALEENKGVQWVIRALPALLSGFPDLQYWVLGEGAHRRTLEEEVRTLGLERQVRLLGNSDQVASFLAAADIGCLLSRREAFPLAVLEYMSTELPVVCSARPPFDTVVNPENGVLVDETNTSAVAEGLAKVLSDPTRRHRMGQNGRQSVLNGYTWDAIADRYLSLFG